MVKSVQDILEENKVQDLENFLKRRHNLNRCNSLMIYLFHIVQSIGILASSYSASSGDSKFLWAGIGLNMTASLIQIYEKINLDQMKRIYMDIQSIKNNIYLDESAFVEMELGQKNGSGSVSSPGLTQPQTIENST